MTDVASGTEVVQVQVVTSTLNQVLLLDNSASGLLVHTQLPLHRQLQLLVMLQTQLDQVLLQLQLLVSL